MASGDLGGRLLPLVAAGAVAVGVVVAAYLLGAPVGPTDQLQAAGAAPASDPPGSGARTAPTPPEEQWEAGAGTVPALVAELERLRSAEADVAAQRARVEVIRRIGALEGAEASGALRELLHGGADSMERLAAANVLWARGEREVVEEAARSGDRELRAKVQALRAASK